MNIHTLADATNRHPADGLKSVRDRIKELEKREKEIRSIISGDREQRVGDVYHAIVSERTRVTVDWKGLPLGLGASEAAIAAATKTTAYEVVEMSQLPDLREVLRLLTEEHLILVDTATTGFSPAKGDRIISIGILTLENDETSELKEMDSWHYVVNPQRRSNPQALAVHGFTDDDLAGKPLFSDVVEWIVDRLDGATFVAHNAPFDVGFINSELGRCGIDPIRNNVIDTRVLSKFLWPGEPATLDAMCERLGVGRLGRDQRHDALEDCRILAACLPGLVKLIEGRIAS